MNLFEESAAYVDSKECALEIRDRFVDLVNSTPYLKEHRDYTERMWYGFGERAFLWMWKLLADEMPADFKFLEVGVYVGQILTLMRMLAEIQRKNAEIYGVTLLSTFGGNDNTFPDIDYRKTIEHFHRYFALEYPQLIVGDSTARAIQAQAKEHGPYDLVYVDGCHDKSFVKKDLKFYPYLLKKGGFLVVDDCACKKEQPWGFFQGIVGVCEGVEETVERDPQFKELFCVVHNRVWQRV